MVQLGLYGYIAFKLQNIFPRKPWFLYSFLIGSVLPGLDIIVSILYSKLFLIKDIPTVFETYLFHSIFTVAICYFTLLIIYEIKKNINILFIASGLTLGLIFHIGIDTIAWLRPMRILWPLPVEPINMWATIKINPLFIYFLLSLEFIFFRLFAHEMINIVLEFQNTNRYFIKKLSKWMKVELILFIIFFISIFLLNNRQLYMLYSFFYVPSTIMLFYSIFLLRDSINKSMLKENKKYINEEGIRKTTIDNIG